MHAIEKKKKKRHTRKQTVCYSADTVRLHCRTPFEHQQVLKQKKNVNLNDATTSVLASVICTSVIDLPREQEPIVRRPICIYAPFISQMMFDLLSPCSHFDGAGCHANVIGKPQGYLRKF
jgi:hypothetical protein